MEGGGNGALDIVKAPILEHGLAVDTANTKVVAVSGKQMVAGVVSNLLDGARGDFGAGKRMSLVVCRIIDIVCQIGSI
jgi:hypothetical protein